MESFLASSTRELIARVGLAGLADCTLVFPMQRAGLFVKQAIYDYMRESGETAPVVLPRFTTIDSLSDSLSALRADDEVASVFRLYRAYSAVVKHPMKVDAFYGWGQQLLADFSSVDMALLSVDSVLHLSSDASALDELMLDPDTRQRLEALLRKEGAPHSVRAFFVELWSALPDIYKRFSEEEQALGVGTRGARSRWVVEHFEDDQVQQRIAGRHFVFMGFNYLLQAERRLMQLLQEREPEETLFFWDHRPNFPLPGGVYSFMEAEMQCGLVNALPSSPEPPAPRMEAVVFSSSAAEAQYVHDWLLTHHHPGERTAIVVADEQLLEQVIYALPDDPMLGRINITKGYPLRLTALFARMLRILEAEAEKAVDSATLLLECSIALEKDYRTTREQITHRWLSVLVDEAYYQTQVVLRELMTLIRREPYVAQCLQDKALLMSLVRRRLEMVSIPFHGEPLTDIQIIGVLETRLLDFDNVLILNVEEGVVPGTGADRSFLPWDLRKEYHMQTRDEEAKIYAYNFFRLLRRSSHVTFAFSEASTDTGKKQMSRFLMQLLTSPAFSVERRVVTDVSDYHTASSSSLPDTPVLAPDEQHPTRLSPSAISDYIECPKQYYLKHIRGIHEAEEESVLFTVSTFGSLVHGTLEAAYKQEKRGEEVDLKKALDEAYQEVNELFLKHHPLMKDAPYVVDEHEAENHAILEMIKRVLAADGQFSRMENLSLEEHVSWDMPLPAPFRLTLHGFVDRLDYVEEGADRYVRVVDYKTGGFDKDKMQVSDDDLSLLFTDPKKRYALQTLIYSAILRHTPFAFDGASEAACAAWGHFRPELFYPRNPSEDRRLQLSSGPLNDYVSQLSAQFEPALQDKVQEILSATAFPMTEQKQCEDSHCYCPFHLLCSREKKD